MNLTSLRLLFIYLTILCLIAGCKEESPEAELSLNEKLKFNLSDYKNTFQNKFSHENFSALKSDSLFEYLDTIKSFYSKRNYEPLLIKSYEEKPIVDSILNIFNDAEVHGLNPDKYHVSLLNDEFNKALNDTQVQARLIHLSYSEIILCDALLKYSYHLRYGSINPHKVLEDNYFIPLPDSSTRNIFEPLEQENILQYLNDIQPKNEKYVNLQNALKKFSRYKNLEWNPIPIPKKSLEPGDKDTVISLVSDRLIQLEFLDTSKVKRADFSFYDSLLLNPVKKFQYLQGLVDDGTIGKATIERLNITPEEYIKKIKVNLERLRWIDYSDTLKYIYVNIPDFMLHVIEDGKETLTMKICAGRKRASNYRQRFEVYKKSKRLGDKPDDWETPCMYGQISNLVLNPTWNVPQSIIREEIFAGISKDSTYLQKKNFKVYKDGAVIDYSEVKLNELAGAKIPYRIVQDPGAGNALGKIKFMYKNPHGIYLHDTPNKTAFNKSNRAVSHGCMRVEKPLKLAEFTLKSHSKWNIDYLKIEIGEKVEDKSVVSEYYGKRNELRKNYSVGKTTEVVLENYIPLFVDYNTVWVDNNGDINFREDVYNKDKILMEHLFAMN